MRIWYCVLQFSNTLICECKAQLYGEVQTVFRAEMLALLVVVMHVGEQAEVVFFTGNLGVSNAYHKGMALCHTCINQDMFRIIFCLLHKSVLH